MNSAAAYYAPTAKIITNENSNWNRAIFQDDRKREEIKEARTDKKTNEPKEKQQFWDDSMKYQ
eukprot:13675709-Ditylum_brightwellii.AAC.1